MSTDNPGDWEAFHQATRGRPPRELLTRTLNFFAVEGRAGGVAVDLGCGSGPDARELLRRGWQVHAVDAEPAGLDLLRQSVPPDYQARLHTHAARMEDFDLPPCDLVWAGFALPFVSAQSWSPLLRRVFAALRPGGRFAGDIFGDRHAWASEDGVLTRREDQVRGDLAEFRIEAFDVEDGWRVSGNEVTRWHAFGFAVRKPADPG